MSDLDNFIRAYNDGENIYEYVSEKNSLKENSFFEIDHDEFISIVELILSYYKNSYKVAEVRNYYADKYKVVFFKIKENLYIAIKNIGDNHFYLEILDKRNGKEKIIKLDSFNIGNQTNNLCFFHSLESLMAILDIIEKDGDINEEKIKQYIKLFKKDEIEKVKQEYREKETDIRRDTVALLEASRRLYYMLRSNNELEYYKYNSYSRYCVTNETFENIKKLNDFCINLINKIRNNSPLLNIVEKRLGIEKQKEQKSITIDQLINIVKIIDLIKLYELIQQKNYNSCITFFNTYKAIFGNKESLCKKENDFPKYLEENKYTIEQEIYQKIEELTGYPAITEEEYESLKKELTTEKTTIKKSTTGKPTPTTGKPTPTTGKTTYLAEQKKEQNPQSKTNRPHVTFSFPPEYVNMKKKYHTPPSAPQPNKQEHKGEILHINQQQKTHKNPTIDKQARVSDELNNTPPIKSKQEENNNFKSVVERYKKLLEQYRLQKKQGYGNNYEPSDMKPQVQEQWNNERKKQSIKTIIAETVKEIRKNPNNKNISDTIKHLRSVVIVNLLYIGLSKEKSENIIKKYFNEKYPEQLKPMLLALGYALAENKQAYIENVINTSGTVKLTTQTICTLEGFINLYKTIDPNNQDNIKRLYDSLSFIKRLRTIEDRRIINTELDDTEANFFKKKNHIQFL